MRPYLMVGTVGLVLMVPLAVTSTERMIKRLGPARWKMLHRLAYVVAMAGVLHFIMLVKADPEPAHRVRHPRCCAVLPGGLAPLICRSVRIRIVTETRPQPRHQGPRKMGWG